MSPSLEGHWYVEPLNSDHNVKQFTSGEPSVDDYLRDHALADMEMGASATHVLLPADDPTAVKGFFTLLNCQLQRNELPSRSRSRGLRRHVSATLLAQMGIHQELQGSGLGGHLLLQAFRVAVDAAALSGSYVLVLDALNDSLVGFYEKYQFRKLKDDAHPRRFYITMRELRELRIATPERP